MTLTQEARALSERIGNTWCPSPIKPDCVRLLNDMAKIIEQQDRVIQGAVSKPVRDALLRGST